MKSNKFREFRNSREIRTEEDARNFFRGFFSDRPDLVKIAIRELDASLAAGVKLMDAMRAALGAVREVAAELCIEIEIHDMEDSPEANDGEAPADAGANGRPAPQTAGGAGRPIGAGGPLLADAAFLYSLRLLEQRGGQGEEWRGDATPESIAETAVSLAEAMRDRLRRVVDPADG